MELTISGKDENRLQQVEDLAKSLGLDIKKPLENDETPEKPNGEELYKLMKDMAESGGVTSIKDPVKWQKEIRKDKKLFGRE
mgnify:CR=1 FL=1